jgi:hypothetical protein
MIPRFDLNGLLPPFIGPSPTLVAAQAPFRTDILELSNALRSSNIRKSLLEGLIRYRRSIRNAGFLDGYQILDGSFCEDCEVIRGTDPGDIDAITFVKRPADLKSDMDFANFIAANAALLDPTLAKTTFNVHSFMVDLDAPAESSIPMSIYFFSLFSHQKNTRQWKGTLRIDLQTSSLDDAAMNVVAP